MRRIYYVSDESGHVERYRSTSGELAARRYVFSGGYGADPGTNVHSVFVRPAGEERAYREMVVREVPPPRCPARRDGVHRFRHVDAWGGENGGVLTTDRCACGMHRHHQTRGQCHATGRTVPGGVTTYTDSSSEPVGGGR